jgi:aryl-alcohol dehydrogenase-like predicted oxidoreductase
MDMGPGGKGLSAPHIAKSIEGSLRRLQTDHVDLYQAHQDDPATPFEETLRAFSTLLDDGRVRAIGASNYDADRLRGALASSRELGLPRYESLQPRYNLMDRADFEPALGPLCRAEGLGVLTYSSLASGFLSGKYRTEADAAQSKRGPRVTGRLTDRGRRILAALDEVAGRTESAPSTVALSWLMARPGITAPIASATSVAQLTELLRATDLTLDATSTQLLDQASA